MGKMEIMTQSCVSVILSIHVSDLTFLSEGLVSSGLYATKQLPSLHTVNTHTHIHLQFHKTTNKMHCVFLRCVSWNIKSRLQET